VLRNAGPIGAPGMPEAGALPIPKKLGSKGLKDMVRISDARMSGTAFGTVVLHVTPEASTGGPLALVRDGDRIRLDASARRIDLLVEEAELARRRTQWKPPEKPARGYGRLYVERVTQATRAAISIFWRGSSPHPLSSRTARTRADPDPRFASIDADGNFLIRGDIGPGSRFARPG